METVLKRLVALEEIIKRKPEEDSMKKGSDKKKMLIWHW